MGVRYMDLKVSQLLLSKSNPRFPKAGTQRDVITKMVWDQGSRLVEIAKDIVEEGLDPAQLVEVYFDETVGLYVVLEGNRRITVMKLLENPSEIADESIRKAFSDLQKRYNPPDSVHCAVYDSPNEASKFIILRHTGENNGAGMVGWNPIQQDRAKVTLMGETPTMRLQMIEGLQMNPYFPERLKSRIYEISATNLERLFSNPEARTAAGYGWKDGILSEEKPQDFIARFMSEVFDDFLPPKNKPVSEIYNSNQRKAYIGELLNRLDISAPAESAPILQHPSPETPAKDTSAEKPDDAEESSNNLEPTEQPSMIPGVRAATRKKLFVRGQQKPHFPSVKQEQLYSELIKLDCYVCPITVALGMRTLIDLVSNECAKALKIKKNNGKWSLSERLIKIRENVQSQKNVHCKDFRFWDFLKKPEQGGDIPEIGKLHACVHLDNMILTQNELFQFWDRFLPVIIDMGQICLAQNTKKDRT